MQDWRTAALAGEMEGRPSRVEIEYASRQQLLDILELHSAGYVDVRVPNVIKMVADLQGTSSESVLRTAVTAWFAHAFGFPVKEVECHEDENKGESCDARGGLILFRVRLDASHEAEVAKLQGGESLASSYRERLLQALPGGLASPGFDNMTQISWTKSGSVELGGVAATTVVALIVIAIYLGKCGDGSCGCLCKGCPCIGERAGHGDGAAYSSALDMLQERGAEFSVDPDGSARLLVPPCRAQRPQCFECSIS